MELTHCLFRVLHIADPERDGDDIERFVLKGELLGIRLLILNTGLDPIVQVLTLMTRNIEHVRRVVRPDDPLRFGVPRERLGEIPRAASAIED